MIDTRTGEITEPAKALATAEKSSVSVISMLETAKVWLATAVDVTGPEEIAAAKAQIRTAEVYAKELGLSKEIQQDAQEMVRRAEYALSKAIRKGQDEGTVNSQGQGSAGTWGPGKERRSPNPTTTEAPKVYDFLPNGSDRAHSAVLAEVAPKRIYLSLIYRAWNARRSGKTMRFIRVNSPSGGLVPIPEPR